MAKLLVMKELVEGKTLLSHLFMSQIHKTKWLEGLESRRKNMSADEIENKETVNIRVLVEDEELDVISFFNNIEDQLEHLIKRKAVELVKEQTSDKLLDVSNKINELSEISNSLAEDINWDLAYKDYKTLFEK